MNNLEQIENILKEAEEIKARNLNGDCLICNDKTINILKDNNLLQECIIPEELKDLEVVGTVDNLYVIKSKHVEDNVILGYKLSYLTSVFYPSFESCKMEGVVKDV